MKDGVTETMDRRDTKSSANALDYRNLYLRVQMARTGVLEARSPP
jgi:hypothetical protein